MKRYVVFFLFLLSFLTTASFAAAQSVLDIAQEEVTQTLDISNSKKAIILNMGTGAANADFSAFYNAPKFDLLFRLKYNKATQGSWDTNWEAVVKFRLVRVEGIYPVTNGVLPVDEITPVAFAPFDELGEKKDGILELKINQSSIEDVNAEGFSQVFVDYLVAGKTEIDDNNTEVKLPFERDELYNSSITEPFTTAVIIEEITVTKDGNPIDAEEYMPVTDDTQDPVISFEVTPKPREVYGKVGDFVDAEEAAQCNTGLCYREEFEELVWKKIENAHFYDLEWVFIDKYDSKTITKATEAFARRKGVRIRTSDRHYLIRLGTELTYPEGRVFFRIRGLGKLKPEENSEVVITTGQWNYGSKYIHLGAPYLDENDVPIAVDEDFIIYKDIHEEAKNWQYATVFAEEGKYKKVMSYFDPSLRSTQTLTNFTTDASNTGEDVTLVEESFYDYEGRAVIQTIPAPLHTSSLAHQSVTYNNNINHDRVNFFENNDKGKYDNLAAKSPALYDKSLTASYYSANPAPEVDFSDIKKFKHQDFVPVSDGYAYTQVRYTNDGTGRVRAQSGVGEVFKMGGGKEVKTYYLNPSEEELRRLFGNQLGDISHYKKVLTIDPNGQKSVAYIDQAGQTVATGLVGDAPEQLRALDASDIPDFKENLIKSNQRTGTVSRTEHTFYNPEENTYILEYSMKGGKTSLVAEGEEICLACKYELEITAVDEKGEPIAESDTNLPYTQIIDGYDLSDCSKPDAGETNDADLITITFKGLPPGEYTIIKELRLTAGSGTEISDFVDALMKQNSQNFRDASDFDAAEKAKKDCLECTEVIEEDGTVTQLKTSNNCQDYPDGYTTADFHNLVNEQMKDQCEADQNRYVLNPDPTNNEGKEINLDEDQTEEQLKENYEAIPLCILCVDDDLNFPYGSLPDDSNDDPNDPPSERDIKKGLKNSYLYDSYMRGIKSRDLDFPYAAVGMYVDREGNENPAKNFGDPMNTDPFWELFSAKVGTPINDLKTKWTDLKADKDKTLDEVIKSHIERDDNNDNVPDLSEEEQKEQSWLIFQGFYQNFKRAHLKVFYQKMTEHSQCDPTAIDILLPELAGTENINLDGLTLDNLAYTNPAIFDTPEGEEDQWEKTWLGYTGTANCGDWADNMVSLLGTKIGQCNQKWSLEENMPPADADAVKQAFLNYCGYQKGQPLANAFKKLYYSPYVHYDWMPEIDGETAWDYVNLYRDVIKTHTTDPSQERSDLIAAFEVHFGEGSLYDDPEYDEKYWDENYGSPEKAELVRAYVESMIRAVSPTQHLADYQNDNNYDDFDQYSEDVNTALDIIKGIVRASAGDDCIGAFYAMLSVPDCKTHTYTETEVPADADDLPVLPTEAWGLYIAKKGITLSPRVIHQEDVYHPTENMAFMVEMTVAIEPTVLPKEGEKIILLHNPYDKVDKEGTLEVGYVYKNGGYHLYYDLNLTVKNWLDIKISVDKTGYSINQYSIEECHNLIITQDTQAKLENGGTQKIYRDGCLVKFDDGINEVDQGKGLNEYTAELFPLYIASKPTALPPGYANTNANTTIKELRIWKSNENFTKADVLEKFKTTTLEPYQTQNEDLLAYFTFDLDTYIDEGELIRLKDKSQYAEDMVASQFDIDEYQSILKQKMSCLLSDCYGNVVALPTVKKYLHQCETPYTFGDGVDLWGGRPLTPPTAEELQADCERITTDLLGDYTERLLAEQRKTIEAKIDEEYKNQCFNSPFNENFTLTYSKKEYHYTLYYYDQAGNLVKTVPPEGVDVLTAKELEDNEQPKHKLETKYTYNTLGQVVWQETPDAGESKFWIDYYGRVKLSQNAQQEDENEYAYSKFDALGRPYEVGKVYISLVDLEAQTKIEELIFDSNFPMAKQDAVVERPDGTLTNPVVDFTLSERTKTFYDKHDQTGIVNPDEQKNLKNRVAAVVVIEAKKTSEKQADKIGAITRYSYDIHGNVEKLWQQLPEETGLPEKTVEYNYDLLSGKVNEVIYNRGGENDEFRHRYLYDGDNRLTQVETSLDGYHWTLEASYFYYAHGPLARIETGEHNLQGTDYFYTLQGWIKGVNSLGLNAQRDLGKDGYTAQNEDEKENPTFSQDEYAYTLNYYNGDYNARAGNANLGGAFVKNEQYGNFVGFIDELDKNAQYSRQSLYNGNVAAMTTSIKHFGEEDAQSMNYRYDQLHRIAAAEAENWDGLNWVNSPAKYRTAYKYDANGNIKELYRNNASAQRIDEIEYDYTKINGKLVNNKLNFTKDAPGLAEGGLETGKTYNYQYDKIGNLTGNAADGIKNIKWNIYGKVEEVEKTNDTFVYYRYDGTGNRIMKKVSKGQNITTTTYLRDASGNVMAIYEEKTDQAPAIKEIPIYGSGRLGQYRPSFTTINEEKIQDKKTALGQRIYEFSNHLGNVLVTLTDNKVPDLENTGHYKAIVLSASDYYPFGMAMKERTYSNGEYRYGFNGKEDDTDFGDKQLIQDYGFRLYNPAIAKFLSADPLIVSEQLYPELTPYQFASNNPIRLIDLDGLEGYEHLSNWYYASDMYLDLTPEQRLSDAKGVALMGVCALAGGITLGYALPAVPAIMTSATTAGTATNAVIQTGVVGATVSGTLTMVAGGTPEEVATNYTSGFVGGAFLGGSNVLIQKIPALLSNPAAVNYLSAGANYLAGGVSSTADNITKQIIEVETGQTADYAPPEQVVYNFMSGAIINSAAAPLATTVTNAYAKKAQSVVTEKTTKATSHQAQASVRKQIISNSKGKTPNKATLDKKVKKVIAKKEASFMEEAEKKIQNVKDNYNAGLDAVGKWIQGHIIDWWDD